jgi:hypothetical protein
VSAIFDPARDEALYGDAGVLLGVPCDDDLFVAPAAGAQAEAALEIEAETALAA